VILTPVVPICMFAYFLMRFQFLPLVLERTFVYGAFLGGLILLHELALRDVASTVQAEYRVNLAFIEFLGIAVLVLAYQPLRRRVLEALRYLLGSPRQVREENRRLAVELAAHAGRPVPELLDWFAQSVPPAFQIEAVALWLFDAEGISQYHSGSTERLSDLRMRAIDRDLRHADRICCTRADVPSLHTLEVLREAGAWGAIRLQQQELQGLLVFWPMHGNQPVADESVNALLLLVEQLAATLDNSRLLEAHRAAERRMLQQEKLSTLGLLAGSIAHEVKNPLSSMKTIASVLVEELGEDSQQAEGLQMIVSEVDRLVGVTNQLLEIARPARSAGGHCDLRAALAATCRLLRHHAHNAQVSLEMRLGDAPADVQADGSAVREILFNLLLNGIEAAGAGGRVVVESQGQNGYYRLEIRNSGPAIPPATLERLFEPFFTTKPTGTGLGLYLVAQRTRELGGEIRCRSSHPEGTCFELHLPAVAAAPAVSVPAP
jgi:signal transduction histidine kinase